MKLSHTVDNVSTYMGVFGNDRISYLEFCGRNKLGHSCLKVLAKPHNPVRIIFVQPCHHKTMALHKLNKELKVREET